MKQVIRLTESDLHRIVKESVRKILREGAHDYWREVEDKYLMREKLPRGWEKMETSGGTIYTDPDGNTYYKDEYGKFKPYDMMESIIKKNVNRILSEDGEGGMGSEGFDAGGMSLDFGGDAQPAEDKGATSSLRNKTYTATASITKKKDPSLGRKDVINFGEGPVGHRDETDNQTNRK